MDRPDGGGLLGIQAQAFAGNRIRAAPVGEGGRFAGQLRQPFTAQRLQRRFIEFQFANLMTPDFARRSAASACCCFRERFRPLRSTTCPCSVANQYHSGVALAGLPGAA